jgi:hypothetical protein
MSCSDRSCRASSEATSNRLVFGESDHGTLGNCIYAERDERVHSQFEGNIKRVASGDPALLHRGRRERRRPDHIAGGIDTDRSRLEVVVHPSRSRAVSESSTSGSSNGMPGG